MKDISVHYLRSGDRISLTDWRQSFSKMISFRNEKKKSYPDEILVLLSLSVPIINKKYL